jgi:diguanylate cyclase (GGDEF)-like protein
MANLPLAAADPALLPALARVLAESRTRLKDFLLLAHLEVWEIDHAGRFAYISERGLLGWGAAELVGRRPHEFGLVASDALATPFLAQQPVAEAQLWLRDKNNEPRCLLISAIPQFDDSGAWIGARGCCRDITEAQEQASALAAARTRERIVSHILRVVRDGLSPDREFLAAARALTHAMAATGCVIFRRQSEQWQQTAQYGGEVPTAAPVLCEATLQRGDALQLQGSGHEWLVCRTQHRRTVNGAIAIWRPPREHAWSSEERHLMEAVAEQLGIVWAQITTQEALIERADRDGLTGLVNQRAFAEGVSHRLGQGAFHAVLLNIDLDNFKTVNDHLGHKVGDDVLKRVAEVLQKSVRAGDIAARVGGDEFLLWIERADVVGAGAVGERIHEGIGAIAASLPDLPKKLGASIGIAAVHKGDTLTSLMQRADATMYKAKRGGKGQTEVAS